MGGKLSIPKRSGWVGNPHILKGKGGIPQTLKGVGAGGGKSSIPKRNGWVGNPQIPVGGRKPSIPKKIGGETLNP